MTELVTAVPWGGWPVMAVSTRNHYLMRLAHLFNTLARFSKELAELFSGLGVQAAIGFIRNTLTGPWLDPRRIEQRLDRPFRLRLL